MSAIATAAAAIVALCVWLFSLVKDKRTTRKQIAISRYLLIEEMARVSSAALAIWKYCGDPIPNTSFVARYRELDEMLRTHRAESLISKVADLPDDLCVALSKFISEANILRTALASICRGMQMKKVHQYPKGHEVNEALIVRSEALLVCSQDLAKLLEREVRANEGDVTSEVAKLPVK